MRRSADEIGATSISFRPKVFSDATSVVDGIFSAHRVLHDKNQPRSRRLRACIEGMMNALGVGERLAEIRKSRKKRMSHADECVRLAGLTDDLIVRDHCTASASPQR